jgi:hypothetical protein
VRVRARLPWIYSGWLSSPDVGVGPCSPCLRPNLVAITTLAANRRQRLTDQLFIGKRAIDFGGVEESHAAVNRSPQQPRHLG